MPSSVWRMLRPKGWFLEDNSCQLVEVMPRRYEPRYCVEIIVVTVKASIYWNVSSCVTQEVEVDHREYGSNSWKDVYSMVHIFFYIWGIIKLLRSFVRLSTNFLPFASAHFTSLSIDVKLRD